jgi:rubredoxin
MQRYCFFGMRIFLFCALICCLNGMPAVAASTQCAQGQHDFETAIVDATDTTDGSITYTCRICGYSYTEPIPATGHQWSDWITDKEPTCGSEGHAYRYCLKNDDAREAETLPATGAHDFEITTIEPTCTENGTRTCTCKTCGYSYTETISALGHDYGPWIVDVQPAVGKEGHQYALCTRDASHRIEETLPALAEGESAGQPVFPNTMDFILLGIELLVIGILAAALASQYRIIRWDGALAAAYREEHRKKDE